MCGCVTYSTPTKYLEGKAATRQYFRLVLHIIILSCFFHINSRLLTFNGTVCTYCFVVNTCFARSHFHFFITFVYLSSLFNASQAYLYIYTLNRVYKFCHEVFYTERKTSKTLYSLPIYKCIG